MNEENQDNTPHEEPVQEPAETKFIFALPPLTTALIALGGIFLLYQIGGAILTIGIFGLNIEKADINSMRMLTMGSQILLILLPALILGRYVYGNHLSAILRIKFPTGREIGIFVIGLALLTPLLQNMMSIQNYALHKLAEVSPFVKNIMNMLDQLDKIVEKTYGSLLASHSIFETFFIALVVAVIPALCEETLFRGLIQSSFELRFKPVWSILITALFFGLYHFNPYGLIALSALGAYFGFAAYTSNSIFVPMILHFINNLIAVLAYLILGNEDLINTNISTAQSLVPQLFSFVMLTVLFLAYTYYISTNYHKLISKKEEAI